MNPLKNTDLEKWRDDFILERLCKAFKEANDEGKTSITVDEFHELYSGPELGLVLEDLDEHGVKKGIIKIKDNQ